jgi:hypothetical protein
VAPQQQWGADSCGNHCDGKQRPHCSSSRQQQQQQQQQLEAAAAAAGVGLAGGLNCTSDAPRSSDMKSRELVALRYNTHSPTSSRLMQLAEERQHRKASLNYALCSAMPYLWVSCHRR